MVALISESNSIDGVQKTAIFSGDMKYRFLLRRIWDRSKPRVLYAGLLNPSTADAMIEDPTITRVWRRAMRLDCGELVVWNLGAGRATDPQNWLKMDDPIGERNDFYIKRAMRECKERNGRMLVGWGSLGTFMDRNQVIVNLAATIGINLYCLGVTKNGQPKHPLYLSNNTKLRIYHAPR